MLQMMQEKAFMMIAQVGTAKSMYIEALQEAKKGDFEKCSSMMEEADKIYSEAHHMHFDLVQKEAQGEELPFSLLLMHAEDQLLNTETVKLLIVEIVELHEKLSK